MTMDESLLVRTPRDRPALTITPVGVDGGGVIYEWKITEPDVEQGGDADRVLGQGFAASLIEAARDAGNATYDAWGYAETMGRLAVIGEHRQVVSVPYVFD